MNVFTVSFFGHRELHDVRVVDDTLKPILKKLMSEKEYVSFLIGRNGEFDEYAASVIKKIKKEYGESVCELTLVLPYRVADMEYYEKYYDSIIIPEAVHGAHPKVAIMLRNRWMVERSDLVIVNVSRNQGGAYAAKRYAEKLNKRIVNLYYLESDARSASRS